ncbi:hypothetical protein KIPB_016658, partial [Kipferlia bialata]|eukprot:g16658.t1
MTPVSTDTQSPLRKRAARVQPKSQLATDRDRATYTPPTTTSQEQSDTLSETDGMRRSVGCNPALGAEGVDSVALTTERHSRNMIAMTTDPTSETDTHESSDEDTEDSAAGGDVLMDG